MPVLVPNRVFRSRTPTLRVENPLPPGRTVFRLTVVDSAGNESAPTNLVVTVQPRRPGPTPIFGPVVPPVERPR